MGEQVNVRLRVTLHALVGGQSIRLEKGAVVALPWDAADNLLRAGYAEAAADESHTGGDIETADDAAALGRATATGPAQKRRRG